MEGQNPAHFSKQLVRFLRNTLVAKVAGSDSAVLQVSHDERQRAARVAGQFSEEDLARFLQIMLRTHDELGYRQEQRFHLELGVLKMVHAQRILPLEQVLSQLAAEGQKGPSQIETGKPNTVATKSAFAPPVAPARSGSPSAAAQKTESISPFEADRTRKTRVPEPEMSSAPSIQVETPQAQVQAQSVVATAVAVEAPELTGDEGRILGYVISELESAGFSTLAAVLETGSAVLKNDELAITIAKPASVFGVLLGQAQKLAANAAASAIAGRQVKIVLVSGAPANGAAPIVSRPAGNGTSARSRAAEDPIVRRMREKFGAEIRTVIDYRDKN